PGFRLFLGGDALPGLCETTRPSTRGQSSKHRLMLRTGVGDGARTDRALLDLGDDALEVAALAEDGRGLVQVPVPVGVVVGLERCTEARDTIWRRVDVRGGVGGRLLASLGGCLSVLAHGILHSAGRTEAP